MGHLHLTPHHLAKPLVLSFSSKLFSTLTPDQPIPAKTFKTFSRIYQQCSIGRALNQGKQAHSQMIVSGFKPTVFVVNCLIQMYVKCCNLDYATKVFDGLTDKDTVSWNTMIFAYAWCGKMEFAQKFFDVMPTRDVVSWNSLVSGYLQNGNYMKSIGVCVQMRSSGMAFDPTSLAVFSKACSAIEDYDLGIQIHCVAVKMGFDVDVVTGSSLLDMYAKCNKLKFSLQVFHELPEKNWVSWSAVIAGCVQNNHLLKALEMFKKMQIAGIGVSQSTYASVFRSCAGLSAYGFGSQLHGHVIKTRFSSDVIVGTATLDMYAKCGSMSDARKLFNSMPNHNLQSYNAIIIGYARSGQGNEALYLFLLLLKSGLGYDEISLSGALGACAVMKGHVEGLQLHGLAVKSRLRSNICVSNAILDMYGKCGYLIDASCMFSEMVIRDAVSWNAIISAHEQNDNRDETLQIFVCMLRSRMEPDQFTYGSVLKACIKPDNFTFATILDACANLATVGLGMQLHAQIIKQELHSDSYISSTLVDMYSKCGNMQDSRLMFEKARKRDPVTWNAMICGYAHHGLGEEALKVFEDMQLENVNPNRSTFVSVLRACAHIGNVEKGLHYFHSMQTDYNLAPQLEHYSCMVDIIGRSGQLREALRLIEEMPFEADAIIWRTLLSICKLHGDIEVAEKAATSLLQLDSQDSAAYVLLSNIYADSGMWEEMSKMRRAMRSHRVKKEPGCSWIEVKDEVNAFFVGDMAHPRCNEIYEKLHLLVSEMKVAGYMPFIHFDEEVAEEEIHEQDELGNFMYNA
ncbi:hypothetical protein G4B88_000934 [Cannabis sativa]|uniref:Pentatricopeptide repeat-containing protein n=1 Tax=Cannabis sativa TaxID=3483 RepID=A0A7J6E1Y6_CANSA|nr:hypothetical protein G4B88_000934 [Cannabis sativa]